jgi:hypothetical protein
MNAFGGGGFANPDKWSDHDGRFVRDRFKIVR